MIYFWHNDSLCLKYENEEEEKALTTLYYSFEAGLKPNPNLGKGYHRNIDDQPKFDDND